ncbi:MAG: hypothetical protein HUJ74_01700 [Lachnospiraceae bacterium]|nr:hypothetical protein [Lachnospiraceae bacterium]
MFKFLKTMIAKYYIDLLNMKVDSQLPIDSKNIKGHENRIFLNNYREIQKDVVADDQIFDRLRAAEKFLNRFGTTGCPIMFRGR